MAPDEINQPWIPCGTSAGIRVDFGVGPKGLEWKRIRIPWGILALTIASSPYNKGPNEAD